MSFRVIHINPQGIDEEYELPLVTPVTDGIMPKEDKNKLDQFINFFNYKSDSPSVLHQIQHNLDSFFIEFQLLVQDMETGYWSNDLAKVEFTDSNNVNVYLSEASHIILMLTKRKNS